MDFEMCPRGQGRPRGLLLWLRRPIFDSLKKYCNFCDALHNDCPLLSGIRGISVQLLFWKQVKCYRLAYSTVYGLFRGLKFNVILLNSNKFYLNKTNYFLYTGFE